MMQRVVFEHISDDSQITINRRITAEDVGTFASLSGDANPIHLDDAIARKYDFRERIAQGALINAFLSGILGTVFSNPAALCLSLKTRFLRSVYIGDDIQFVLSISHKSEALRTLLIDVNVFNQEGCKVLSGEALVKMLS